MPHIQFSISLRYITRIKIIGSILHNSGTFKFAVITSKIMFLADLYVTFHNSKKTMLLKTIKK